MNVDSYTPWHPSHLPTDDEPRLATCIYCLTSPTDLEPQHAYPCLETYLAVPRHNTEPGVYVCLLENGKEFDAAGYKRIKINVGMLIDKLEFGPFADHLTINRPTHVAVTAEHESYSPYVNHWDLVLERNLMQPWQVTKAYKIRISVTPMLRSMIESVLTEWVERVLKT